VLDLRPDLQGIPHVHFAIAVGGSCRGRMEGDTRVLALQSFLDMYHEHLTQEALPDPDIRQHERRHFLSGTHLSFTRE
jgi:hypothetical protein